MANFCLMPEAINKFKAGFADGSLNPEKLASMSSEERHQLFSKLAGEDVAKGVNASFESKLLLKNQQKGMITWAKSVSGMKPEVQRDLITRIQKLDKVLDPGEQEQFLKDLASTKLGVGVTQDEAKKIADLSKAVASTKEAMDNGGDRMAYGRAKVALGNYVGELKGAAEKTTLKEGIQHPLRSVGKATGLAKSIKASLDDSAIFRQGWKTMMTNPKTWAKNTAKSFSDLARQFKGHEVLDEVHADIMSRPNYERMVKAKLAVSNVEEAFPSTLPEKVPIFGRAYKASEAAYTGFVYRQRADIFDKYLDIAKKAGENIDDPTQLKSIGNLVNSLTGRGSLGKFEGAGNALNTVFFSPRNVKGHIDTLLQPFGGGGANTSFARKQAAKNLLKVVVGTTAVLKIADAVKPGSVDYDPRSSNFGKIKVGNTRFDVTGGASSILTLAARLATQSSKNSSTGVVTKLGGGFGQTSGMDIVNDFLENKLSPAGSVVKDVLNQQDFSGNKPTIGGEIKNAFMPLPVTTYQELNSDPHSANHLAGMIADGLGIATNTYGKSSSNWDTSTSKELQSFKSKVGVQKFKEAAQKYNTSLDNWNAANAKAISKLSDADKTDAISTEKDRLKAKVLKDYGFKYKAPKSVPVSKRSYNRLLTPK